MQGAERIRQLLGDTVTVQGAALSVERSHVNVAFTTGAPRGRGRSQRIRVSESETHLLLESVAVRDLQALSGRARIAELILRMNHATGPVALRQHEGALWVFIKLLKRTLDRDEAVYAILALAREADRLEALLTGRDIE